MFRVFFFLLFFMKIWKLILWQWQHARAGPHEPYIFVYTPALYTQLPACMQKSTVLVEIYDTNPTAMSW